MWSLFIIKLLSQQVIGYQVNIIKQKNWIKKWFKKGNEQNDKKIIKVILALATIWFIGDTNLKVIQCIMQNIHQVVMSEI